MASYSQLVQLWSSSLPWWDAALRHSPTRLSWFRAVRIFFVTNLARYAPGGVWQFAGLAAMSTEAGASPVAATRGGAAPATGAAGDRLRPDPERRAPLPRGVDRQLDTVSQLVLGVLLTAALIVALAEDPARRAPLGRTDHEAAGATPGAAAARVRAVRRTGGAGVGRVRVGVLVVRRLALRRRRATPLAGRDVVRRELSAGADRRLRPRRARGARGRARRDAAAGDRSGACALCWRWRRGCGSSRSRSLVPRPSCGVDWVVPAPQGFRITKMNW